MFVISCPGGDGVRVWKHGGVPVGRSGVVTLIGGRVLARIFTAYSGRCWPIAQSSGSDHDRLS